MTTQQSYKFKIALNRNLAELDSGKRELASYLAAYIDNDDIISAVELAAYEALINIYDHESKNFQQKPIILDCKVGKKHIVTNLTYEGNEFDITKVTLPDIVSHFKQGKKRGLGIYFIRTLMDKVEYKHTNSQNKLKMVKNIHR